MDYVEALREFDEVLVPEAALGNNFQEVKCGLFPKIRFALQRQVSMSPIDDLTGKSVKDEGYNFTSNYLCPNCKQTYVNRLIDNYCSDCGQAIDWSD